MKKTFSFLLMAASMLMFAQVGISSKTDFVPNQNVHVNNSTSGNPMLDVDGKVRIRTAAFPASDESYSPLVRNNKTGEVKVISQSATVKPFNYVTYRIENPDQDWVSNLNTQIPTDRYSLAVIGYRFYNAGDSGFINMSKTTVKKSANQNQFELTNAQLANTAFTAAANVYTFKEGNTWRLYADYAGGGSRYWSNAIWEVDVLVIDNTYVNVLNKVTTPLGGRSTGTAAKPAGLGL